jgi:hypothetical protein
VRAGRDQITKRRRAVLKRIARAESEASCFMTQSSEERLGGDSGLDPKPESARILPFQRPPTDLQRAVQIHAQEMLERERERGRTRPAPLRWTIIFVLALLPVVAVFTGVDAFVRAFHKINDKYSKMPVPAAQSEPAPADSITQEPGVVILQPLPAESETTEADSGG